MAAAPEVAPKPPKTDGEKPAKTKKEKPPKEPKPPKEKPVKTPKVKKAKPPKPPREPREKKPLNKKLVMIVGIAVLMLLLVGAGIFIAKMLTEKNDSKAQSASSDIVSSEPVESESAESEPTESEPDAENAAKGDPETVFKPESSGEEGRDAVEGDAPETSEPDAASASEGMVGGVGGVSAPSQPEKPFEFDERSLSLPPYSYQTSNSLERAVHADLQKLLDSKDERPGVGIAAVVIADQYLLDDGTLRVLAYVYGNRYAIAENTLFDYGSMAGPVAIDYAGSGVYALETIHLPRPGDAYEQSVKELCGPKEETAKRMVRKGYDLELRGQMIRNAASYIAQNQIDVDYFRVGSQTYHKNGEIYIPKNKNAQSSQAQKGNPPSSLTTAPDQPDTQDAQASDAEQLEEDYKNYQKLPL